MKFVCSWSGGKDSTASIILAHENNEPLDIILFAEVIYDHNRGISGENPRHMEFIHNTAKPLFESWGYQVEILKSKKDYLSFFNHIIQNPTKHQEHKGLRFGFPHTRACGIKRDCKEKTIKDYLATIDDHVIQYIGICPDERKRLGSLHKYENRISLLEKYGYSEKMAMELCREYNLLSPCYELSSRGGCWFCPNAKLAEHREIKTIYPEIWKEFVSLERESNIANAVWNVYGKCTLHEINEQLKSMD
ncbi:hypothetical protein FMM75_15220 [Lachnospiraceae bacterium MD335]|nr:hypothetical protein [Lachnospiraceae bacterium MD335]